MGECLKCIAVNCCVFSIDQQPCLGISHTLPANRWTKMKLTYLYLFPHNTEILYSSKPCSMLSNLSTGRTFELFKNVPHSSAVHFLWGNSHFTLKEIYYAHFKVNSGIVGCHFNRFTCFIAQKTHQFSLYSSSLYLPPSLIGQLAHT